MRSVPFSRCDIEAIIARLSNGILKEPLLFFSESDIHALFYHNFLLSCNAISIPMKTGVSIGVNQRGQLSNKCYSTIPIHREYGLNGIDYARSDLVIFNPTDINRITDPINLKTGRGKDDYLSPEYILEFGTEKRCGSANLFEEHIRGDLLKTEKAGSTGYIIHIQRVYSRDRDYSKYTEYIKILNETFKNGPPIKTKILFFLVSIGHRDKKIFRQGKIKMYSSARKELIGINMRSLSKSIIKELKSQMANSGNIVTP